MDALATARISGSKVPPRPAMSASTLPNKAFSSSSQPQSLRQPLLETKTPVEKVELDDERRDEIADVWRHHIRRHVTKFWACLVLQVLLEKGAESCIPSVNAWIPISTKYACEENDDGSRPASVDRLGHQANLTGGLHACQGLCNEYTGCQAVDWFNSTRRCNLYATPCLKPTAAWDGASSYQKTLTCWLVNDTLGVLIRGHCHAVMDAYVPSPSVSSFKKQAWIFTLPFGLSCFVGGMRGIMCLWFCTFMSTGSSKLDLGKGMAKSRTPDHLGGSVGGCQLYFLEKRRFSQRMGLYQRRHLVAGVDAAMGGS